MLQKPEPVKYACVVCGKPVIVRADGDIMRVCEHKTAGITASMQAHAVGVARVV